MVAFHFPPLQGSSGMQRTLGFARHLPKYGWRPVILAPKPLAYAQIDPKQSELIPRGLEVERSFCLDTARHLSVMGRYPDLLATPDRWISWVPSAVLSGLRAVRRYKPDILWSTYPIASAHIIGRILSRRTGIPWVADFRDPMVELNARTGEYAPANPRMRRSRLRIERGCAETASALVFCTDSARAICTGRYPGLAASKSHVIPNGFEESVFEEAFAVARRRSDHGESEVVTLLHSGTIYPTADRDPRPFFDAVERLKREGGLSSSKTRIILRATGHDAIFLDFVKSRNIDDIVHLVPPIPYIDALAEMLTVDGLLLFQGYTSNPAIPAKLYEYLRARKPILALIDVAGSTAELLRSLKTGRQASIEDAGAIGDALTHLLEDIREKSYVLPPDREIAKYSRAAQTAELAEVFENVIP